MKLQQISEEELVALLQGLPSRSRISITVDTGATNTRLGVMTKYFDQTAVLPFYKWKVSSVASLSRKMGELEKFLPRGVEVRYAAINIPGPTDGTTGGPIANFTGSTEEKMLDVRNLPQRFFPKGKTLLLNDLEAAAYGVLTVQELRMFSYYFGTMWKGDSFGEAGNIMVVAPGTGLGAGLLHYHPTTKSHSVLPLEMGHTNIATSNPLQTDFLVDYANTMGRGDYPPEYDDVVSGRGLERLYQYLEGKRLGIPTDRISKLPAEQISKQARAAVAANRSSHCSATRAMELFNDWTMHFTSQMGMGFIPKTVLLIGDNVVNNGFFYGKSGEGERMKGQLLKHSTERMGFMSRLTLYRQVETTNMNLLGCAFVCAHNSGQADEVKQKKRSSKL